MHERRGHHEVHGLRKRHRCDGERQPFEFDHGPSFCASWVVGWIIPLDAFGALGERRGGWEASGASGKAPALSPLPIAASRCGNICPFGSFSFALPLCRARDCRSVASCWRRPADSARPAVTARPHPTGRARLRIRLTGLSPASFSVIVCSDIIDCLQVAGILTKWRGSRFVHGFSPGKTRRGASGDFAGIPDLGKLSHRDERLLLELYTRCDPCRFGRASMLETIRC